MEGKHINDDEIQDYLDKLNSRSAGNHWEPTDDNRDVRQYRMLYKLLACKEHVPFSTNFADRVIAQIDGSQTENRHSEWLQIGIAVLGFSGGIAVMLYYTGIQWLLSFFSNLISAAHTNYAIFTNLSKHFTTVHFNFTVLGLGVLILILMSVVDRIIVRSKIYNFFHF